MPKVRIYTDSKIIKNVEVNIDKSQYHYLINVMRKKNGDKIFIFNEDSGEWEAKLYSEKFVKVIPLNKIEKKECNLDIWICFSLIKPRNLNFLVEKVSELGVRKILPISTEHSFKAKINVTRLKRIALEAVEQSQGLIIPDVENVLSFDNVLSKWDSSRTIIFCDEDCDNSFLESRKIFLEKEKFAIFLGPVGGWSSNERKLISNQKNCLSVSLGNRLLKADTAAITALSSLRLLKEKSMNV